MHATAHAGHGAAVCCIAAPRLAARRCDVSGARAPLLRQRPSAAASARQQLRVQCKEEFSNETKLRSEVQAPFRVVRQFFFGALAGSAAIGTGISFIQLVTGALGAPAAPPVAKSSQNFGIDLAALLLMGFLYKREEEGRQKQMSRISREERLGNLRVELVSGKVTSLSKLRGFARVVIAAGPAADVRASIEAAEPFKAALLERGVVFVPYATDGGELPPVPTPIQDMDKRWRAEPLYANEWKAWLDDQLGQAKLSKGTNVYVSLRIDGRVRASGKGTPPWEILAASLPPVEGFFAGFLDGMDGRVGET